ncbi:peptide-methionine (R)-S-oxide reductase MsrB [Loktanella sp. DJP18]|uniref:peptide-methionine (R)-S-oxide reductase MsrB n=1 Tax=Loktanella sp. DJP18 TaxID=3409788 RepID=UPI003BB53099
MKRRNFLTTIMGAGLSVPLTARRAAAATVEEPLAMQTTFGHDLIDLPLNPVTLTETEWRAILTAEEFAVLRDHETERAFTSPLNEEKRAGTFTCAGCDLPLYRSENKFDSGTGWPSFTEAIEGAVGTMPDRTLVFLVRTEVHCARCQGLQGHVLGDGPPPFYNRHCINGVALNFVPDGA